MKKMGKGLIFTLVLAGIVLVGGALFAFNPTALAAEKPESVQMKIDGMTCGMCSGRVKANLDKIADVKESEVSHEKGTADVKVTKGSNHKALEDAVKAAGFKVTSLQCECKG